MSSAGQAIGGVVGAFVGWWVGGPQGALYGAQIGMGVGSIIDPAKGPNINGPRLNDLTAQTSTYGAPIPRIYGTIATHGNVFWLENNRLKEVETTETQGGKGGAPESETTTYSYYATFAVGLCRGPIAGVRRIWVGGRLIYNAGAGSIESIIASNQSARLFDFYPGTDDQLPNPRMQADVGVANCPAYRGLAYLVFHDLPLVDYGNSLMAAQVKVELVGVQTDPEYTKVAEVRQTGTSGSVRCAWDAEGEVFYLITNGPAPAGYGRASYYVASSYGGHDNVGDGTGVMRFLSSEGTNIVWRDGDFATELTEVGGSTWTINDLIAVYEIARRPDGSVFMVGQLSTDSASYYRAFKLEENWYDSVLATVAVPLAQRFGIFGDVVFSYSYASPNLTIVIYDDDLTVADSFTVAVVGFSMPTNSIGYSIDDSFYLISNDRAEKLVVIDPARTVATYSLPGYTTDRLSFVATSMHMVENMLRICGGSGGGKADVFTYSISSDPALVQLADIVENEIDQSSLVTVSDIDVSALAQSVRGYKVSNVAAIRSALEPLRAAWPFDMVQSGYKLKAVPRGGSSVATIDISELDARVSGAAPGVSISEQREMDAQIPRRVSVVYLDVTREYDTGEQYAERLNTDAIGIQQVEMAIALNGQEAAGMSEVLLYLYWLERCDVSFTLPPTYRAVEPADVVTIVAPWATYELRLVQVSSLPDGRMQCAAKFNAAAIYSPTAAGAEGAVSGIGLELDGPSMMQLLDVPLLRDADNSPGFPAAMCGYSSGWPGGVLVRSSDGGATWNTLRAFAGQVPVGYCGAAIGVGRFDMIDASNRLSVRMVSGAVYGVSRESLFAGANWFAYGAHGRWEIIAVQSATLELDGSYTLSNLLRGRFGTEWAASMHAEGDILVQIDDADVAWVARTTADIGVERLYRAITIGRSLDSDASRAFTYAGVNLKPLSPIRLNGNRHPSTNDWSLVWIRRGRVDPLWRNYVDVPVGEASETYELEIYATSAYATLKRTITGLTTPAAAYTSAQQVADFGSNQSTLYVRIYQISEAVGRGYPLQTAITR